jgi:hypothetical protein
MSTYGAAGAGLHALAPGGLFPQGVTVQANAELREALLKTQRQLAEAEAREDQLKARLLRADREREEAAALRYRLAAAEQELRDKDTHIADVERLCTAIGNEHDRAMAETHGMLERLDGDRRLVADQREEIRRLRSRLAQDAGRLCEDAALMASRTASERLQHSNQQMERNIHLLEGDNKTRADQVRDLLEQLKLNQKTMSQQNDEISRLTESVRMLRDEKLAASRPSSTRSTASAASGQAFLDSQEAFNDTAGDQGRSLAWMRERLSQAEVHKHTHDAPASPHTRSHPGLHPPFQYARALGFILRDLSSCGSTHVAVVGCVILSNAWSAVRDRQLKSSRLEDELARAKLLVSNTYGEDVVKRQETIMKLIERNVFLEAETKVSDCRAHS